MNEIELNVFVLRQVLSKRERFAPRQIEEFRELICDMVDDEWPGVVEKTFADDGTLTLIHKSGITKTFKGEKIPASEMDLGPLYD